MLVGGSALYTRAILDRFEFPGTDESVRRELEEELARAGAGALHRRLRDVDAEAAAKIGPENGRRIVRALEVIALTGRPYSASLPTLTYADPRTVQIGVDIDRPTLDARIETRVRGDVRRRAGRGGRRVSTSGSSGPGPRAGRSATATRPPTCAARSPARRRSRGPRRRRGASPGVRTAGSARTRGWCGCASTTRTGWSAPSSEVAALDRSGHSDARWSPLESFREVVMRVTPVLTSAAVTSALVAGLLVARTPGVGRGAGARRRVARPTAKIPTAVGQGGAVSTVDPEASAAALKVLKKGGNAADAAIAAAATLGVTEPYSAGIGGGGYFVYYDARDGQGRTVDGRETAPQEDADRRVRRPGDRQALPLHP